MIQKIDNATVREAVQQAYERCKNETGGKNADYIPYLANVPSTLFGIAACLPDGEVIAVGDTDYKFGIGSAPMRRGCLSIRSWRSCSKTTIPRRRW